MSDLTFDSYQHQAAEFAVYSPTHAVTYPLLGLVGEVVGATGRTRNRDCSGVRAHGDRDVLSVGLGAGDFDVLPEGTPPLPLR